MHNQSKVFGNLQRILFPFFKVLILMKQFKHLNLFFIYYINKSLPEPH